MNDHGFERTFASFFFSTCNIFASLYGGDCRGVGRRTSYAEFFHFFHQRCFGVARGLLGEAFGGFYLAVVEAVADGYCRQDVFGAVGSVVVGAFDVDAQEAVEFDYFAGGDKVAGDG